MWNFGLILYVIIENGNPKSYRELPPILKFATLPQQMPYGQLFSQLRSFKDKEPWESFFYTEFSSKKSKVRAGPLLLADRVWFLKSFGLSSCIFWFVKLSRGGVISATMSPLPLEDCCKLSGVLHLLPTGNYTVYWHYSCFLLVTKW